MKNILILGGVAGILYFVFRSKFSGSVPTVAAPATQQSPFLQAQVATRDVVASPPPISEAMQKMLQVAQGSTSANTGVAPVSVAASAPVNAPTKSPVNNAPAPMVNQVQIPAQNQISNSKKVAVGIYTGASTFM